MYKWSYLQKSEPHFSMSHAEKQTEAANYELSRVPHHCLEWWLDVVK